MLTEFRCDTLFLKEEGRERKKGQGKAGVGEEGKDACTNIILYIKK